MTALQALTKARTGLVLDHVFFGHLALRLKLVEDKTRPTAWTDGSRIGYNPNFINSLSVGKVKTLIAHEIMHCILCHHTRKGDREHQKWNRAADYAINLILAACGFEAIEGRLLDSQYVDMSAEAIYNLLPDEEGDGCGCGEVRQATGEEAARAEEDWRVAVAQAAQQAKAMGKLPGNLARLVDEIVNPCLDWRVILRRFVQQTASNDYSWFPPNRRYIYQNLYLPSVRSNSLPPMVIAVDTSGSIGSAEISQFASEITAILEEYKTSCQVLYCDADVSSVEEFSSDDLPLVLHPSGGGGTDFVPAFNWVDEQGIIPSCLIYLTDGCCNSYPDEPCYPVLWAKTGRGMGEAPFGEEMEMRFE